MILRPVAPDVREQASRALVAATGDTGFSQDDRADLVRIVSQTTRATPADAQTRVDQSINLVKQKLKAMRHGAIILAFITAAAAAAAAVAAAEAARLGGRKRDGVS